MCAECKPGAIRPLGEAIGLRTVVDDELASKPNLCFEARNHEQLIRVNGSDFATRAACAALLFRDASRPMHARLPHAMVPSSG